MTMAENLKLGELRISVHGPGASIEAAVEVADATKKLLDEVAKNMGIPEGAVAWRIASVQFKCDGCGLLRPDKPSLDEGWTHSDGDDFCPECSAAAASPEPERSDG